MGALALYGLLDGIIDQRPLRALAAFIAAQPNLLYGYGLVGGFKELITAGLLVLAVALLRTNRFDVASWRSALPIAVVDCGRLRRHQLHRAALAGADPRVCFRARRRPPAGMAVPSRRGGHGLPASARSSVCRRWGRLARRRARSASPRPRNDLGNLAAPLEPWTSVGVWLTGDYRYPLTQRVDLTYVLVGLRAGARRRRRHVRGAEAPGGADRAGPRLRRRARLRHPPDRPVGRRQGLRDHGDGRALRWPSWASRPCTADR